MEDYKPSLYIQKYLDYLMFERKLSDNTLKSYRNDLKDFDLYFKGNISKLNYFDIQKYLDSLKDLNARSVAHYITVINSMYTFLVDEGVVKENPCINITGPKIAKKLPNYLTEE